MELQELSNRISQLDADLCKVARAVAWQSRSWQPIATLPASGEVLAGYYEGTVWTQTIADADLIKSFPEYTHWMPPPSAPMVEEVPFT